MQEIKTFVAGLWVIISLYYNNKRMVLCSLQNCLKGGFVAL